LFRKGRGELVFSPTDAALDVRIGGGCLQSIATGCGYQPASGRPPNHFTVAAFFADFE